jgi:hypothetical protein
MATYDERARQYATNAKQEYLNSLSYLTDDLAAKNKVDQQALADKYNTLYDQIARQQDTVNQRYSTDAQAAYLNKLMADRALDEQLSQLGVSTQGFGVNQRMLNETAYGQNKAVLQQQRSDELADLANQLNDARGQYNVASGQLASDYLAALASAKQNQQTMADKYYTQAYNNYLADLQYQDQMAQQQWENDYRNRQLAASKASASASAKASSSGLGSYAETRYNQLSGSDMSVTEKRRLLDDDKANGRMSDAEYNKILGLLGMNATSEEGLYDRLLSTISKYDNLYTKAEDNSLAAIKTSMSDAISQAYYDKRLTETDAEKLLKQINNLKYKSGNGGSFGGR